jgi:hypothetical protein
MVSHYGEHETLFDGNGDDDHRYGSIKRSLSSSSGNNYDVDANASIDKGVLPSDNDDVPTSASKRKSAPQSLLTNGDDDDLRLLRDEMAGMANLAAPVVLTNFLEMLPGIITLILVGHTKVAYYNDDGNGTSEDDDNARKLRVDAASLAVMFTNIVALSPAYGECILFVTKFGTACEMRDISASS